MLSVLMSVLTPCLLLFTVVAQAQELDPASYYRLTTQWQGDGKSLDILNDGQNNKPILAATANYSSQMWKLTPLGNGFYRLTTQWQGDGKSLDIINDGQNNKPILAATGNYSGQMWKLAPLGNGFYRLTTQWQGDGKSLDIINDGQNNKPILAATGNYSGQMWKLTQVTPSGPQPTWTPLSGTGTDVGVGANGVLWVIGTDPASAADKSIYQWDGSTFRQMSGAAVRIAVDPNGRAWVVNSGNAISRWTGSAWQQMPGAALDIGIGANGSVWVIGSRPGHLQLERQKLAEDRRRRNSDLRGSSGQAVGGQRERPDPGAGRAPPGS